MSPLRTLLIVEDQEINRILLRRIFAADFDLLEAENGQVALDILRERSGDVDLVLLDVVMPVMDGHTLLRHMRREPDLAGVPVIILTSGNAPEDELRALDLGANDFISKPYDPRIMRQRVKNLMQYREMEAMRLDNSLLLERALAAEELRFRANHDPLTGIFNRQAFCEATAQMLAAQPNVPFALVLFNIERFKLINDLFGKEAGDEILQTMAACLEESLHGRGSYGRLQNDHFAICFPEKDFDEAFFEQIQTELHLFKEQAYSIKLNVGVYMPVDRTLSVEQMCDRAGLAAQSVKGYYNTKLGYYDERMRDALLRDQEIVEEMESALRSGQFVVWYQPQYNHATGQVIAAEALVRWQHPHKGLISPSVFIPVFERNGFIAALDAYVWESVCQSLRRWLDGNHKTLPVSVNISRVDMYNPRLKEILCGLIHKYNIPFSLFRLEITESAYVDTPEEIIRVVEGLKEAGFIIEMDDFGSGYSSLNALKDVPVDILKLDLRFLSGGANPERGGNILSSVVRMAKWLALPVIAEGVETAAQADFLKEIGCHLVQGFLYARPMPQAEYEALLARESLDASMPKGGIQGLIEANSFWDPNAQTALLFNSFVGAAAIFEVRGDRFETLRVNDMFYKTLGLTMEEYESYSLRLHDLLYPEDLDVFRAMIKTAVETGDEAGSETRWRHPRRLDACTWLRTRIRLIAQSSNQYICYAAIENITNHKLLEQAHEATKARLQSIVENLPSGLTLFQVGGLSEIIFSNDAYYHLMGYSRAQFAAEVTDTFQTMEPEDRAPLRKLLDACARDKTPFVYDYRARRRDGSLIWLRAHVRYHELGQGHKPVFLTSTTDISADKQIERLQLRGEERYRLMLRSVGDVVLEYDPETDVLSCSFADKDGGFSEMGMRNFLSGLPWNGQLHESCRAAVEEALRAACRAPLRGTLDCIVHGRGGRYQWFRIRYASLPDKLGQVYLIIGTAEDVQDEYDFKALSEAQMTRLLERARFDSVTGLPDYDTTRGRISVLLATPSVSIFVTLSLEGKGVAARGRETEEKLLRHVAETLKNACRTTDIIGRVSEKEFVILYRSVSSLGIVRAKLRQLTEDIRQLGDQMELPAPLILRTGMALIEPGRDDFDTARKKALQAAGSPEF